MGKRALIYLAAGVFCALAAVLVAAKYLGARAGREEMELTKVLVASKAIQFGSKIALKSEAEGGNVGFTPWPVKYLPEGAITSPDDVKDEDLIARANFVRYQPILRSLVVPEAELVPSGMFLEYISVDPEELVQVKPGDRVDILRVTGQHDVEEYIRCAQVYSVGVPPATEGPSPAAGSARDRVYILLPVDVRETVLAAKLKYTLMVSPSKHECAEGMPELVSREEDVKALEADRELAVGEKLLEGGQYKAALDIFQKIVAEYADLPASEKALQAIAKCRDGLSAQLLEEARTALQQKAFQRCIDLSAVIAKEYPEATSAVAEAQKLAEEARSAEAGFHQEAQYRQLCEDLQAALKGGNVPMAKQLLEQLDKDFGSYVPPPSLISPADVKTKTAAELKDLEEKFEALKRLIVYFLGENAKDKALEKFKLLRERYPDHPYVQEAEEELAKKGWLE